jgi:hypothetical protein
MATAAVKRYWTRVAELGCLVCQRPAQIAHMHGPSIRERNPDFLKPKGRKHGWQDWLVAPLCVDHHWACDYSPLEFNAWYGTPAQMVDRTGERLGVDPWAMATALLKPSLGFRTMGSGVESRHAGEPRRRTCVDRKI